ncbi:hypothetical protein HMPREF9441_02103 [Paraprevotella clara YIT 11840]|uniref:Uncharacterized protein n=1 Tax=Paraprevotella clara YIT 11840 TaxID=762968 RepID=G5SRV4_9BACT|nr:hypothetical protein HMPREF9441_02103 [Paraprevotella clara YIT 11840]
MKSHFRPCIIFLLFCFIHTKKAKKSPKKVFSASITKRSINALMLHFLFPL